jgi:AcrR family transcriptional regulator
MIRSVIECAAMARPRPPDRFQQLLDAALRVFARKGVRRARMQDIAREMGVSPGSLYNYVESKEALFHWIVERSADDGVVETPAELPIRTPAPVEADKRLREQLAAGFRMPALEAALARRRVGDAAGELESIARELYARISRARRPMTIVERSAVDLPELFDVYFVELRRDFFQRLARYVARRQRAGHFRDDLDPGVAARVLVETITYFARHRFGDQDPGLLPDDDLVRENVVRMVVAAFLPTRRSRP